MLSFKWDIRKHKGKHSPPSRPPEGKHSYFRWGTLGHCLQKKGTLECFAPKITHYHLKRSLKWKKATNPNPKLSSPLYPINNLTPYKSTYIQTITISHFHMIEVVWEWRSTTRLKSWIVKIGIECISDKYILNIDIINSMRNTIVIAELW